MNEQDWTPPPGKPVVAHVVRPRLPWRTVDKTYCGKDPSEFSRIVELEEARSRWKQIGQTRGRYEFCVTCIDTANRHQPWSTNPCAAVAWEYERYSWGRDDDRLRTAKAELQAVALVLEAHREEFDLAFASLLATTSLSDLRTARRARKQYLSS